MIRLRKGSTDEQFTKFGTNLIKYNRYKKDFKFVQKFSLWGENKTSEIMILKVKECIPGKPNEGGKLVVTDATNTSKILENAYVSIDTNIGDLIFCLGGLNCPYPGARLYSPKGYFVIDKKEDGDLPISEFYIMETFGGDLEKEGYIDSKIDRLWYKEVAPFDPIKTNALESIKNMLRSVSTQSKQTQELKPETIKKNKKENKLINDVGNSLIENLSKLGISITRVSESVENDSISFKPNPHVENERLSEENKIYSKLYLGLRKIGSKEPALLFRTNIPRGPKSKRIKLLTPEIENQIKEEYNKLGYEVIYMGGKWTTTVYNNKTMKLYGKDNIVYKMVYFELNKYFKIPKVVDHGYVLGDKLYYLDIGKRVVYYE